MIDDMYRGRPLSRGYPKLEELSVEWFKVHQSQETPTEETTRCLENLIDLSSGPRTVAVVGCGPNPYSVEALLDLGYDAVGIEPVPGYAEVARAYLGDPQRILVGSAERLPLRDQSQKVVLLQSVLEHVDSPIKSLEEAHRVTSPGGVTFVSTTNRHRFSVTGHNDEFRVRFYNWLPQIAKECYVFKHLHFDPTLELHAAPCGPLVLLHGSLRAGKAGRLCAVLLSLRSRRL